MKNITAAETAGLVWDLSSLYTSLEDTSIFEDAKLALAQAEVFHRNYKDKIATLPAGELKRCFQEMENILVRSVRPMEYVRLRHLTDTADPAARRMLHKLGDFYGQIQDYLLFFRLELAEIDASVLKEQTLQPYEHFIGKINKSKKHQLSEAEEKLINLKDLTGIEAFRRLYADYTVSFLYEWQNKKITEAELRTYRENADPQLRYEAAKLHFGKYEESNIIFTNIYNSLVKDFQNEAKLRGYGTSLQAVNRRNELTDKAVDTLVAVTTENNVLIREYFRLKAPLIGMDKLRLCDLMAPTGDIALSYSLEEAKNIIITAFSRFDKRFAESALTLFEKRHIHSIPHPRKASNSFCSSFAPTHLPYISLNFRGSLYDVLTLAHELGHAVHFRAAARQTYLNFYSVTPLAEVAGIFAETILTEYLLSTFSNNGETLLALLSDRLQNLYGIIFRQNMFTRFEQSAHQRIGEQWQTAEQLCDLYRKELETVFGDSVQIPVFYRWEWASIPHIHHSPFYCYNYSFAQLLAFALYQNYKQEQETFAEKFFCLLKTGGAKAPTEILSSAGIDIEDENFWQSGFTYIKEKYLEPLKNLV